MTDQEINEAVDFKLGSLRDHDAGCTHSKDYCHSIEAAWELVDKIPGFRLDHAGDWQVTSYETQWPELTARADTAPMAICLAFLKLP